MKQPSPQDGDFDNLLSSLGNAQPSLSSDENDPDFDALLNGPAPNPLGGGRVPQKNPTIRTQFQQSTAPTPVSAPELSWQQVGQQALKNAPSSALGVAQSLGNAVMHPVQTVQNIGQLGAGALSQAQGALGVEQDPAKKAKTEALVQSLENHYKQAYFSGSKNLKQTIATDPASVLLDASMVADPAAGVLGKLGEAGKLGALSGAATAASKALPYINPIKSAVAAARLPGNLASKALRGVGSVTSGVPASVLKIASDVGASGDPSLQQAFSRFATGQGNATELANRAQAAMGRIRDDASQSYLQGKAALISQPVPLTNTQTALTKAASELGKGSPLGFADAKTRLQQIQAMVDSVANNPDPVARNLDNVDTLKQQIYDLHTGSHAGKAGMITDNIYHGVKADLVASDPKYASLMDAYTAGLRNINDLGSTLGVKKATTAASATLAKSLKALKTPTGQNLFNQLATKDPTLSGMIAGAAVNPWSQHMNSLWETAMGAGIPSLLAHPVGAMAAIPGAAIGFAASSPRIVGSAANLAGQASRPIQALASPAGQLAARGTYYAGRGNQEQATQAQGVQTPPDSLLDQAKTAVSGIESAGSGGYSAIGPTVTHRNGTKDHAIGKYQVMASNVPDWTEKYYGQKLTPEQFKDNPDAQEKVFEGAFGDALQKYGNIKDALSWWHSGVPLDQAIAENRHDPNMSTKEYVDRAASGIPNAAAGGRIGLASGGKVDSATQERLVQRLMSRAKKAKIETDKITKPLLRAPDDAVAKALEIAGRSI